MKKLIIITGLLVLAAFVANAQQRPPNPADMQRWNSAVTEDGDGDASITRDLSVTRDAGVTGNLTVTGDASAANLSTGGNLTVTGTATVGGDTVVTEDEHGDVSITRDLSVTRDAGVTGDLTVTGDASAANLSTSGNLTVTGTSTFDGVTAATIVAKVNETIAYLDDGLLVHGAMSIDGVDAEKFQTEAAIAYTIAGVNYAMDATDQLVFSASDTINNAEAAEIQFGAWLVQIDAAGDVTTKPAGGHADQTYTTDQAAIDDLPDPDAGNVALGYILVESPVSTRFTADSDALTGISTFSNTQVKTVPTAIP